MSLRIAFAGPSGTGKTTLAEFVSKTFNLECNPVGSRSVAKAMGFASPYDVDAAGKRGEFQRRLLLDKSYWEAPRDNFVTDRTLFDNVVYQMLHDVDSVDGELLQAAKDGTFRYTHVIVCPMLAFFNLNDDSARKKSLIYHELFETTLRGFIERYFRPNDIEVLHMSRLQDRQKRLTRLLEGKLR